MTLRNRLAGIVLSILCVTAAAGCTTTSSGTPLPGPTSSTEDPPSSSDDPPPSEDDELPSDGAPKVQHPFDASHFEQNPCELLSPENTSELKVGPTGEPADTNFGKGCSWRNSETGGGVTIGFTTTDKRGLSGAYRENKNGDFLYFEPIDDIEGHPAVAYSTQKAKPTASCSVAVGITDQLSFSTLIGLSAANVGVKNPCEEGARVAGMAMRTMKEES
jgi:hypothetical protein